LIQATGLIGAIARKNPLNSPKSVVHTTGTPHAHSIATADTVL
jgi:hypothetical protein